MADKQPYMKFFPSDWLSEETLRGRSLAARGLWIDMLCLMHKSTRRGYLLNKAGTAFEVVQLARAVGSNVKDVSRLLQELEQAETFSRDSQGVIYCRRMVAADAIAQIHRECGAMGGRPPRNQSGTKPKPNQNQVYDYASDSASGFSLSQKQEAPSPRDSAPIPRPGSAPTETAAQEFARLAAEADTAFGGDGDIPPEPNALMLAVGRYCDSVGIGNESTRYRIYQDCESWAGPEAFGPQIVAEGLRWGIEHSKPWKVVASHIRSKAETSGWVDKKAKDKPAGRSKAVERFMAGGDA